MKLWDDLYKAIKDSPDPLSTGLSYLVAYLYVSDLSGQEVVSYLNNLSYEDAWRMILGLAMILIGHRSFQKPESVKIKYVTEE